ncbi:uncharacterized protein PHACADRAFT_256644 [Phanerochaete carnosa HHB-10118-sp]|uniref:FAS1 domain-containing protein n=1 Tax=Phanerochaete carnosa (strain HHB-10118-sp) TaxID=650164 RepID=K5V002_PHACS|nr:uncharacterized protein PHACADRAFT_256644 [Phanerochaete carnosa HHB-10118-sp]EKM55776.1 hypothetical protein PHACADRAFT_256644 [Phanerochaete carnosa HHB-10118-sp]
MLARSLVALLSSALVVAAVPGGQPFHPYEDYDNHGHAQWVAGLFDSQHPGMPKMPGLPVPPGHTPHPPHHAPPKVEDKTIYQALEDDERFSRLHKVVKFSEEITSLLNDSSQSLTFFAIPDRALKQPKHRHGKHKHQKNTEFDEIGVEAFFSGAITAEAADELELFAALEGFVNDQLLEIDEDDDEDKERKKKVIKKIITAVLKYHILPGEFVAHDLAKNLTHPTALTLSDGSFHGEPLRLRVEQPPRLVKPTLTLNFYSKVVYADVKTKNGLVHVLTHPLFPPPSTFTTLFAFSDVFSTLTSAIQRVEFTDAVDWHWVKESKTLEGSPAITFFAPTNKAFHRLPRRLKFYLFSPFGQRALKKILSFHTVPEFILHSNWVHNASDEDVAIRSDSVRLEEDEYEQIPSAFDNEDFGLQLEQLPYPMGHGAVRNPFYRPEEGPINIGRDSVKNVDGEWQWREERLSSGQLCTIPTLLPGGLKSQMCKMDLGKCGCRVLPGIRPPQCCNPVSHPPHPPPHHGPFPHPKPVFSANITLPTLLPNHTLSVHVRQIHSILPHRGYTTLVFVNGIFAVSDVPARNGAVHVVDRLISPRRHSSHGALSDDGEDFDSWEKQVERDDQDWEEWEEWLPRWAAED